MSTRPPVNDWATDFDHLDPRWIENPYPIWEELRTTCPVAHTERFRGVYFPSRYEDVRAVAYDTENFSSRRIIVRETPPPRIPAPPITSDPPEHKPAKQLLLPPFTPDAMKKLEPESAVKQHASMFRELSVRSCLDLRQRLEAPCAAALHLRCSGAYGVLLSPPKLLRTRA